MRAFEIWGMIVFMAIVAVVGVFYALNTAMKKEKNSAKEVTTHREIIRDDLYRITFKGETQFWVIGDSGVILHSEDGGKTWSYQKSGVNTALLDVCFIDEKNGWAVGNLGTVISTQDGGSSWKRIKSNTENLLTGVHFFNPQEGLVIGEAGLILRTENGGIEWTEKIFMDGEQNLNRIFFVDSENGWVVGEYGLIMRTRNAGRDWARQESGVESTLFDIFFVNRDLGFTVGLGGTILKTLDGGENWKKIENVPTQKHLFGIVAFQPTQRKEISHGLDILIVGNGISLYSQDNKIGENWKILHELNQHINYDWLYHVTSKGIMECWTVGKNGSIFFSKDLGTKWSNCFYPVREISLD